MNRPLRLQYPGALYHVTARGDRQSAIFRDDADRLVWLALLERVCARHHFVVHGFCQMTNHFHVVAATLEGNLAAGMRMLNGHYSQYFNRRYDLTGHVFQGRYKAILVQKESYLLELTRYVVLNPLRAGMVSSPEAWPWSSYRYVVHGLPAPGWLDIDTILRHFSSDRGSAIELYRSFVLAGIGMSSPLLATRHQLILGDAAFVGRAFGAPAPSTLENVSKIQRRAAKLSLPEYQVQFPDRDEAMAHAYHSTAYTMQQVAAYFGVSAKTVSRAVIKLEKAGLVSKCRN